MLRERIQQQLEHVLPFSISGRVVEVCGPVIKAYLQSAALKDFVSINLDSPLHSARRSELRAQVVGFNRDYVLLSPFGSTAGIFPGATVTLLSTKGHLELGAHLLGSVVDSLGRPLTETTTSSDLCPQHLPTSYGLPENTVPCALSRKSISTVFESGIKAIDAFVTIGKGQRLVILAEPGVGKSMLLAMIARHSRAQVNVFGLIGERGREVKELLEDTLDAETRARSVIIVSTSDEAALSRLTAAHTATRIAEYFRDQGLDVLLQLDSLTRLFRAYREVGLASGEPPVRRGYPPSVFAELPRLIERAGTNELGSITALYTVLLSSDLDEDPMVDEVKGLTDGHLVLTRELAEAGHYPAIDVLSSISRCATKLLPQDRREDLRLLRRMLARLKKDKDLVLLGGVPDAELEIALQFERELQLFLEQDLVAKSSFSESMLCMQKLATQIRNALASKDNSEN